MLKERRGFLAEYDRKTARQKIDMVSFHNLTVKFLEAHRRGSGGPAGGGISQNVHTPAILYPPTGRKIVVSYMHSQEPRAARPWPGTGGEICHPRACSAAGRLCILPPGCGGRQTTPRPRVLNIKREKNRPGAGTSSGPILFPFYIQHAGAWSRLSAPTAGGQYAQAAGG